ncbi:hypothetical protein O6H91_04G119300 [Diphasiastrum complanatum]|uniref:Uncharacterized protein n=1 Tax=Diphasiastrum complanatum TaxID=34168 RepID=A0ACC2E1T4_DIPCM|nr:hypothetical protein O6H91_04G119300 [Diphasiastrum complanatum]
MASIKKGGSPSPPSSPACHSPANLAIAGSSAVGQSSPHLPLPGIANVPVPILSFVDAYHIPAEQLQPSNLSDFDSLHSYLQHQFKEVFQFIKKLQLQNQTLHGELTRVILQNKDLQSTIDMMKEKGMQDTHSQQDVESKISSLAKEVEKTRTWASVFKQDGNFSSQVQPYPRECFYGT